MEAEQAIAAVVAVEEEEDTDVEEEAEEEAFVAVIQESGEEPQEDDDDEKEEEEEEEEHEQEEEEEAPATSKDAINSSITNGNSEKQSSDWDIMIQLVGLDEAGLGALTSAGIKTMNDLELFGEGTTTTTSTTTMVANSTENNLATISGLSPMMRQRLLVLATYLIYDGGPLTPTITLAEMARYNAHHKRSLDSTSLLAPAPRVDDEKKKSSSSPSTPPRKKMLAQKTAQLRPTGSSRVFKDNESTLKRARATGNKSSPKKSQRKTNVDSISPKKQAAATPKKRQQSAPNKSSAQKHQPAIEVYRGPPTHGKDQLPGEVWPDGWIQTTTERTIKDSDRLRWDREYFSPNGKKFRSILEVKRFLIALEREDGDETKAYKIYKTIQLEQQPKERSSNNKKKKTTTTTTMIATENNIQEEPMDQEANEMFVMEEEYQKSEAIADDEET